MGQCGCGDTAPEFRLPGPDGITYGIQVYESCHDCHTPVAVDVYRFDEDEAREWLGDRTPLLSFQPYDEADPTNAIATIPILDPAMLVGEDPQDPDTRLEGDEVTARYVVRSAVWRTRNAFPCAVAAGVPGLPKEQQ